MPRGGQDSRAVDNGHANGKMHRPNTKIKLATKAGRGDWQGRCAASVRLCTACYGGLLVAKPAHGAVFSLLIGQLLN